MLLVIVATPEPVPVEVDRSRWPVHVTIVGTFHVDTKPVEAIPALIERAAQSFVAFDVKLGPPERFGTAKDVPVLLAAHPSLRALHESLATALAGLSGFDAIEPPFWHAGYRPHASLGPAVRVREGDTLRLRVITLVSLEKHVGRSLYSAHLSTAGT
ncbi:hypothetical protein GCM10028798_35870 [Humibacter antri]